MVDHTETLQLTSYYFHDAVTYFYSLVICDNYTDGTY